MALLTTNCPRCGVKEITFDIVASHSVRSKDARSIHEVFCICRSCKRTTVFVIQQKAVRIAGYFEWNGTINEVVNIMGYISLKDRAVRQAPEHTPEFLKQIFEEAATCLSVECFAASVVMSRKCVDLAVTPLIPEVDAGGPKKSEKMPLGPKLKWLFDNDKLPATLHELAENIREDGNDGAHTNHPITKIEAEDVLDFVDGLFERLYTEPGRLAAAKKRREDRRSGVDRAL